MRIPDPNGAWTAHPDEPASAARAARRRRRAGRRATGCCARARIADHDGFTIPTPRPPEGLDMNRNFPAGWGTGVRGHRRPPAQRAGDRRARAGHRRPAERLRLQRLPHQRRRPPAAVVDADRDSRCRRSTSGRGSSSASGARRSPATRCTRVFEDFTWDPTDDDERRRRRLGLRAPRHVRLDHRVLGRRPRGDRHRATARRHLVRRPDRRRGRWPSLRVGDEHRRREMYVDWNPFDHPQLGPVELGGWDWLHSWTNPPSGLLQAEVAPHAEFAVFQALGRAVPRGAAGRRRAARRGDVAGRAGIANTGWLPTDGHRAGPRQRPRSSRRWSS